MTQLRCNARAPGCRRHAAGARALSSQVKGSAHLLRAPLPRQLAQNLSAHTTLITRSVHHPTLGAGCCCARGRAVAAAGPAGALATTGAARPRAAIAAQSRPPAAPPYPAAPLACAPCPCRHATSSPRAPCEAPSGGGGGGAGTLIDPSTTHGSNGAGLARCCGQGWSRPSHLSPRPRATVTRRRPDRPSCSLCRVSLTPPGPTRVVLLRL